MPHRDTAHGHGSWSHNDIPTNGRFDPIVPGTGHGYALSRHTLQRVEARRDTCPDATSEFYHMMGLPRGTVQGIPHVREAVRNHIDNRLAPGSRLCQMEKDGCATVVNRILFSVSKFMMFLIKDMGVPIRFIYDLETFIGLLDRQTLSAFCRKLEALNYKSSTMKQIEFQLHLFLHSLADIAERHGLSPGNLRSLAAELKRASSSRGKAAKMEARQCFTRVNQKKKLGIDEDPAPDMLWQAFMKCYQRVKVLMEKMMRYELALMCFLELTCDEHMELRALFAVLLSMMYGGARCSLIRNFRPAWLRFRNGRYRVDPSVSAEKLKTADWSAVANIDIHTQIGELLAEYIGVLRTMVESQMPGFDFELDFTLFFQADDPAFRAVHNRLHDGYADTPEGEETVSGEEAEETLVQAMIDARPVSDHFMHHSLRAVFVDWLGIFADINQILFRHLMAWMNYELWYEQAALDFCGMPCRFFRLSFQDFLEQASADANNSPDVFLRTYCPEGLSRLTRQEEEERAGREADLNEVATNLDQESEQDGSPSDDGTPSDESTPSDITTPSDDTTPSCTDVDEDDEEETIEHARKQKRRRRH